MIKLNNLREIPPFPISSPARTKKGIAISAKLSVEVTRPCAIKVSVKLGEKSATTIQAKPIAKAMGTFSAINSAKVPNNKNVTILTPPNPIYRPGRYTYI